MTIQIACVAPLGCILGEGPVWDEAGYLWWVDIKAPALHRYRLEGGEVRTWPMPEPVGSIALRRQGGLILALAGGLAFFEPESGALQRLFDPEPQSPQNRLNDGKCDAMGRFWFGSMHDPEKEPTGQLYRLDPGLDLERFEMDFVVTNGPAWSVDGATFYYTDSVERRIWAYDFDMGAGRLGARRLFAELTPEEGHPDGMCVDAEDHLWGACWNGARVARRRPDGSPDREIVLPAPLVSSCCFGGPGLDILFVTTARMGLKPEELEAAPLAGGLFAVRGLGVKGRPMPLFAG
ncbi:MAG TPA: SMP-30/gluconolactonase/LRE family protein [Caulobacteraceae bacterium]|jgi:sugar lactone lactonase YvrE